MDFFSIIMFLGLYYIRPQEWIPVFGALPLLRLSVVMAIFSQVFGERSLKWKDFFYTPYDWFMAFYFFWIVWASPTNDMARNFGFVYQFFIFYWVTVLTLSNIHRIQVFLNWWTIFILIIATLAVLSEYGFDPTDAYDKTHGAMKDRLILNMGIYNNPNALGHSVVVSIVLLYFVAIWKRPIFSRITAPVAMWMPIYCVYLTVSKGAFISGATTLMAALSFKRPKAIQIAIMIICTTLGIAGMKALPRMGELSSSKHDEAIQGRVKAFRFGLEGMQNNFYGIGYANFIAKFEKRFHFRKAAHSSFVNVGAELGYVGLFVYCGMLYLGFRTLLSAKTTNDDEERVRRTLYTLLMSYCVSSWMIGWHNRVIYWLMLAGISAFHRLMLEKRAAGEAGEVKPSVEINPLPALVYASPQSRPAGVLNQIAMPGTGAGMLGAAPVTEESVSALKIGISWNTVKWYDWAAMYVVLWAVIEMWKYAIANM